MCVFFNFFYLIQVRRICSYFFGS